MTHSSTHDGSSSGCHLSGEGELMLSERLRWLREGKGELSGLLAAEEARLEHFQASIHVQEEKLLKRVKLTYEAERRRANEHHHELSEPLRYQLGAIEHQLQRLEALADAIVSSKESPSAEEMRRLLTEELPLPAPLPSSGVLQEAWDRVCPVPQWRLTCDALAEQDVKLADASDQFGITRVPQWPSPERADFKGGTSVPLPWLDSESSGAEDVVIDGRPEALRSQRPPYSLRCPTEAVRSLLRPARPEDASSLSHSDVLVDCTTSEESSLPTDQLYSRGSRGYSRRRSDGNDSVHERAGRRGHGSGNDALPYRPRLTWVKKWLESSELRDLIETTAEIEAIRRLEGRHSAVRAKRRLGLRT